MGREYSNGPARPSRRVRGPGRVPCLRKSQLYHGHHNPDRRRSRQERLMTSSIRKAVFPAAGLGTRFLPATKAQPKEMLPLVDKPLIQYVIEEAVRSGIESITIVTGRGKNAIEDHFDVAYELEHVLEMRGKHDLLANVRTISNMINLTYVRQKEALGLGHAILVAREAVGHQPFAVLLGDDIIESEVPCMKQMTDLFQNLKSSIIATCEVPHSEISSYGVIRGSVVQGFEGRVFRVADEVENP